MRGGKRTFSCTKYYEKRKSFKYFKKNKCDFYYCRSDFLCMGFYKKLAYSNPDNDYSVSDDYVNSYVGGDAYNYIINGTYFMAYAVMGIGSLVIATITGTTYLRLVCEESMSESKNEELPKI